VLFHHSHSDKHIENTISFREITDVQSMTDLRIHKESVVTSVIEEYWAYNIFQNFTNVFNPKEGIAAFQNFKYHSRLFKNHKFINIL